MAVYFNHTQKYFENKIESWYSNRIIIQYKKIQRWTLAVYIDNGKQKYSVPRMKYITCLRKVTEHYWNICKHCLTNMEGTTVYPKKYAHGFCFAVLCCGYTLTDFLIFIRLTSLALWQSNDCLSASKATLMNMDKYFMWIHYERLHNHNKAKHKKSVHISWDIL